MSISHSALVPISAVKLLLSPSLIGLASWVSRRWGPDVAGWFSALPYTSGPIVLVLALERGPTFAAAACTGVALALASLAAFSATYAWSARRSRWPRSALFGCLAYVACAWPLGWLPASLGVSFVIACLALGVALRTIPRSSGARGLGRSSRWDIPARMVLAAVLVWSLAAVAGVAGPRVSGLLTPFPIAATIIVAFTHHLDGGDAAAQFLRSLVAGLYSFAVFFLVVGASIESHGIGTAFLGATAAAVATHGVVWVTGRARLTPTAFRRTT